jgi:hypothetical protein
VVLGQPEVIADPVPQAQQHPQFGPVLIAAIRVHRPETGRPGPARLALQAQLYARGCPVQGAAQIGALDKDFGNQVAHPRIVPALLLERADQALRLGRFAEQEERPR